MKRLNAFSIFGMLFLSSILLGNGIYSNSLSLFAQENEAEVEADIEQENKCVKESECKSENEISNTADVPPLNANEPETCEDCFTTILTEQELNNLFEAIANDGGPPTTQELCNYIAQGISINEPDFVLFKEFISERLFTLGDSVGISEDKINEILDCLEKIYGTEFPRPPFELSMDSNVGWEIIQ
ncbi:MAG: hypothetical protein DA328_08095 [Nitrososphaeraceae archaeon]|nr:hypothetical protein [Nitrososphaeraceae archaeon]